MATLGEFFSITDDGSIAAMAARFEKSPVEWAAMTVLWADAIGPVVAHELMTEAPVRTGRLRDSIRYQRATSLGGVELQFHSNVKYVPFVIDGTRPHIIEPVAARALHWHDSGGEHFARIVHHPGTKPNNFPKRTLEKTRSLIVSTYVAAIRKAMI